MLVDSHCHLDLLDHGALGMNLDATLAQAREQGVRRMLCVSITLEAFPAMLALVEAHEGVYASVGVHPNEREGKDPTVEELIALAQSSPRIVAIGETGLDYFRSSGDMRWQQDRFRRHIAAARACGLPLIVHMRDANADTLAILRDEGAAETGGVLHCFTGDAATAHAAMELGFYISFSGIVTFASARDLQQVAAEIPEDRLLVETDSPYLAPVPYRGKSNQPAYTRQVAERIAALRGVSCERIAAATTENFFRLFAKAANVAA